MGRVISLNHYQPDIIQDDCIFQTMPFSYGMLRLKLIDFVATAKNYNYFKCIGFPDKDFLFSSHSYALYNRGFNLVEEENNKHDEPCAHTQFQVNGAHIFLDILASGATYLQARIMDKNDLELTLESWRKTVGLPLYQKETITYNISALF